MFQQISSPQYLTQPCQISSGQKLKPSENFPLIFKLLQLDFTICTYNALIRVIPFLHFTLTVAIFLPSSSLVQQDDQLLEDSKTLGDCGFTSQTARPQAPATVGLAFRVNGTNCFFVFCCCSFLKIKLFQFLLFQQQIFGLVKSFARESPECLAPTAAVLNFLA